MRFHGDMLLTTPVISTLKRNYPDAKIDVLLYQDTVPILSENPEINALYGIVNKKAGVSEQIKNFLSLVKILRNNHYDLIINLADQWISAVLAKLLPAPMKLAHDFSHRQYSVWRNAFTHLTPPEGEHVVEWNLSVLKPLALKENHLTTTMSYHPTHWQHIEQQLKNLGVANSYVVIQPTARQEFKCWDEEKFAAVIDKLQQQGYSVVLTSGPSEDDLNCLAKITATCQTKPITALAGKTSFPELAALIAHAALFIGVDSAPMHIAAAVKTPIICLFGATDHKFWRPFSDNVMLFWAGKYQSMPDRKNLDRHRRYLSCIPANDIIDAAEKILAIG